MNKYMDTFRKNELSIIQINAILDEIMCDFKQYGLSKHFFIERDFIEVGAHEMFMTLLQSLSVLDMSTKNCFIQTVLAKMSPTYVIRTFMEVLVNTKEEQARKTIMDSFRETKFIDDIWYNPHEEEYILSKDNEKIKFKNYFRDDYQASRNRNRCHDATYEKLREFHKKGMRVLGVGVQEKFLDDAHTCYHTFLISDHTMIDPARNLVIGYEDYEKLVSPDVLYCEEGENILKEVQSLQIKDPMFNNGYAELLNYGIHKQMIKEKKN